jgi:hypothetical protein
MALSTMILLISFSFISLGNISNAKTQWPKDAKKKIVFPRLKDSRGALPAFLNYGFDWLASSVEKRM